MDEVQWLEIPQGEEDLVEWANRYEACTLLKSNGIPYPQGAFCNLLAVGIQEMVPLEDGATFSSLHHFHRQRKCWLFGFLGYDLKNEAESLKSENTEFLPFPHAYFYQPQFLFKFDKGKSWIWAECGAYTNFLTSFAPATGQVVARTERVSIKTRTSKTQYLEDVEAIRQHIEEGDVYEMNYCMEFYAKNVALSPLQTFYKLNELSPMPFAVYQKIGHQYALCASPERFVKKNGRQIFSQPIKGTIRRGKSFAEDQLLKQQLSGSEKERAENMMIVDLVRNDLARSAEIGSVKVEEMFGIYTFKQLHQMISTVSANLKDGVGWAEALSKLFPMGSMTGAPKIMAMRLIERYEKAKRGLYSGAIGYVTPEADLDFNVVIRTILYDGLQQKISFQVGSAITYDSRPAQEYEECLLKAQAMMRVLGLKIQSSGK